MQTMISEGDRSGVDTPSKNQKAKYLIESAKHRLEFLLQHWPDISEKEFCQEMDSSMRTLISAQMIYENPIYSA